MTESANDTEQVVFTEEQPTAPPRSFGQFRISTLLSWTAVVSVLAAITANETDLEPAFFMVLILGPPLTCVPTLIDHLLVKPERWRHDLVPAGLNFHNFWKVWATMCVGIYSVGMMTLSTIAFQPSWKGAKGNHWIYYTLDEFAGLALCPIYVVGMACFLHALHNSEKAQRSIFDLLGVATCAAISFWYVFAVLCLNFSENTYILAMVPGGVGVCYALYTAILWRNRRYSMRDVFRNSIAWFAVLLVSILIKIPLALELFNRLSDEPPEDCFVVSAATRGHPRFVGTWFDTEQSRLINQQLLNFWTFEYRLKARWPQTHGCVRWVYNRVGPVVARMIVFRWQADCVYMLLKPVEWLVKQADLDRE